MRNMHMHCQHAVRMQLNGNGAIISHIHTVARSARPRLHWPFSFIVSSSLVFFCRRCRCRFLLLATSVLQSVSHDSRAGIVTTKRPFDRFHAIGPVLFSRPCAYINIEINTDRKLRYSTQTSDDRMGHITNAIRMRRTHCIVIAHMCVSMRAFLRINIES